MVVLEIKAPLDGRDVDQAVWEETHAAEINRGVVLRVLYTEVRVRQDGEKVLVVQAVWED